MEPAQIWVPLGTGVVAAGAGGGVVDGNVINVSLPGGGDVTVRHQPFVQHQCSTFHGIEKHRQRAPRIGEPQGWFS